MNISKRTWLIASLETLWPLIAFIVVAAGFILTGNGALFGGLFVLGLFLTFIGLVIYVLGTVAWEIVGPIIETRAMHIERERRDSED